MMLHIHGLPMSTKYHDLKVLVKQQCNVTDFILDNLVGEGDGTKKVRMYVSDEKEGAYLMRNLDGYRVSGNILRVVPVGKQPQQPMIVPQQNFDQRGFPSRNDFPNQGPDLNRPMDQGRMGQWGQGGSQWGSNQAMNQAPNNYNYQQSGPMTQQFGQQGPQPVQRPDVYRDGYQPARGPMDQRYPQGGNNPQNNMQRRPEPGIRTHVLRSVEIMNEPLARPAGQTAARFGGPQGFDSQQKPMTIMKENFQGPQYSAGRPQPGGFPDQEQSSPWTQQSRGGISKPATSSYDKPGTSFPTREDVPKGTTRFSPRRDITKSTPRFSPRRDIPKDIEGHGPRYSPRRDGPRFSPRRDVPADGPRFSPRRDGSKMGPRFSPRRDVPKEAHVPRYSPRRELPKDGRGPRFSPRREKDARFSPRRETRGRRDSPDRRPPSPRRDEPGSMRAPRRDSPTKRSPDRRLHGRHSPIRRDSPDKRARYSPSRRHDKPQDKYTPGESSRQVKDVRPAYEPSSQDRSQAMYSGGYRPSVHDNVQYPIPGMRPEGGSSWQHDKNFSTPKEEGRRDASRVPKFDPREVIDAKRPLSPARKSRSPVRRERSPLRDRYRKHSMSPRSPHRSWALEKRRSPEIHDAPPPPTWSDEKRDEFNRPFPRDEIVKSSRPPVWETSYDDKSDRHRRIDEERRPADAALRVRMDLLHPNEPSPTRREHSPHHGSKFDQRQSRFEPRDPTFESRDSKFGLRETKFESREHKFEPRAPTFEPRPSKYDPREPKFEPRDPKFEPRDPKFEPREPKFEPRDPKFEPRDPKFEPRDPKFEPRDPKFGPRQPKFEPREDFPERRDNRPPGRDVGRLDRADHRPDLPGRDRREDFQRREEPKEIPILHEKFDKELDDIYKRAVEFNKRAQELRRREEMADERIRHDSKDRERKFREEDRHRERDDPEYRRSHGHRLEESHRHRDLDWKLDEEPRNTMSPSVRAKRDKACDELTNRILDKHGIHYSADLKKRVTEELKVSLSKILKDMYGNQDISFIEMVIKFNAKYEPNDQLRILNDVLASLPNQYRSMKRAAEEAARNPVPAKTARRSDTTPVDMDRRGVRPAFRQMVREPVRKGAVARTDFRQVDRFKPVSTGMRQADRFKQVSTGGSKPPGRFSQGTTGAVRYVDRFKLVNQWPGKVVKKQVVRPQLRKGNASAQKPNEAKQVVKAEPKPARKVPPEENTEEKAKVVAKTAKPAAKVAVKVKPAAKDAVKVKPAAKVLTANLAPKPARDNKRRIVAGPKKPTESKDKQMDDDTAKAVDTKSQDATIKVEPDKASSEANQTVDDKITNEVEDALEPNAAQRMMSTHQQLLVRLSFNQRPDPEAFKSFLKQYNCTSLKRTTNKQFHFVAKMKNVADFDKICAVKTAKCGKTPVTITPVVYKKSAQNSSKLENQEVPDNTNNVEKSEVKTDKTGQVEEVKKDVDSENTNSSRAKQASEKNENKTVTAKTTAVKVEQVKEDATKKVKSDEKVEDNKKQQQTITLTTPNKPKAAPKATPKPNVSEVPPKSTPNTKPVAEEKPKVADKTEIPNVVEKAATPKVDKKAENPKTPIVAKKAETPDVAKKAETPDVAKKTASSVAKNAESPNKAMKAESPNIAKKAGTTNVAKKSETPSVANTADKPKVAEKTDNSKVQHSKVKTDTKSKNISKASNKNKKKISDSDELDDYDILALMSEAIVLDECGCDED